MYKLAQHGYFLTNVNVHLKRSVPYCAVPYRAGATSVNALLVIDSCVVLSDAKLHLATFFPYYNMYGFTIQKLCVLQKVNKQASGF